LISLVQLIREHFGFKYPVEPLIYTPEEWKSAEEINSAFIRLVSSKGIVLYEKE
jgi:hypothetical protein